MAARSFEARAISASHARFTHDTLEVDRSFHSDVYFHSRETLMPLNFFRFSQIKTLLFVSITILIPGAAIAVEPVTWTTNTRAELLSGDAHGVSMSDTGNVTFAPKLDRVYNPAQAAI